MSTRPEETSTDEVLAAVKSSRVWACQDFDESGQLTGTTVGLPYGNFFEGEVDREDLPVAEMFLNHLEIHPEIRKNGIATRLVSSLAHVAISNNIYILHSVAGSPHTFRIFKKLFGDENIYLFDQGRLPITIDQAIESLERAQAYGADPDNQQHVIAFRIYLGDVALQSLEEPIIQ